MRKPRQLRVQVPCDLTSALRRVRFVRRLQRVVGHYPRTLSANVVAHSDSARLDVNLRKATDPRQTVTDAANPHGLVRNVPRLKHEYSPWLTSTAGQFG